jgi:hypothetical protein
VRNTALISILIMAAVVGSAVFAIAGEDAGVAPTPARNSLPPLGKPSCVRGAVEATTSDAVVAGLRNGKDVCVTAAIDDLVLDQDMTSATMEHLGTAGAGSIGKIEIDGASGLKIRARLRSVRIDDSERIVVERSVIGGTESSRTQDNLVELLDTRNGTRGIVIRDNDIGWTCADNSGNTGFGIRAYGDNDGLLIQRNRIHDLAADGIQGTGGTGVVIDRNEIGPVGNCPGSSEHSDNIQITGTRGLRITNNWLHHNGCFDGACTTNAGVTYIHGGSSNLVYENNLLTDNRGRVEVCNLGTGGRRASRITIRRNTSYDSGQAGLGGLEWDCESGHGNRIERNVVVDAKGGLDLAGDRGSVTVRANVTGRRSKVRLDEDGNCISRNCNPRGRGPIGFRKPRGVHW